MKNFISKTNLHKKIILTTLILSFIFSIAACGSGAVHTSGENNSFGYTLLDGDDLYYTKVVVKEDVYYYSCLYKRNLKTKEETLINITECDYLNEVNSFINIAGSDILFLTNYVYDSSYGVSDNITKVKKTGMEPSLLLEEDSDCALMQVVGSDVYYYDESEQIIYKTDKNGSSPKKICEASTNSFFVQGSKLYFSDFEYIYSVSASGGEPSVIFESTEEGYYVDQITYGNGYIYFIDDSFSSIRRIKGSAKNITESELLYEADMNKNTYIERIYYYNKELYFTLDCYGANDNYAVLAYNPATSNTRVVVSDTEDFIEISPFSIWNDTVYFYAMTSNENIMDSDWVWYTVPASGGKATPFSPLYVFDDNFLLPGDEKPTNEKDEEDYDESGVDGEETNEIDGE